MTPPVGHVVKFRAPTVRYPSLNDSGHWRTKADRIKAWRGSARLFAREQLPTIGPVPMVVKVSLPVLDKRRRDPHNFFATVKPIIDGLVDSGRLWPDDTPEFVTTVEPELRYCHKGEDQRVWVILTPR